MIRATIAACAITSAALAADPEPCSIAMTTGMEINGGRSCSVVVTTQSATYLCRVRSLDVVARGNTVSAIATIRGESRITYGKDGHLMKEPWAGLVASPGSDERFALVVVDGSVEFRAGQNAFLIPPGNHGSATAAPTTPVDIKNSIRDAM